MKNLWSASWGEADYIWMGTGKCSITMDAYYLIKDQESPQGE
jgi:hypothetical protein